METKIEVSLDNVKEIEVHYKEPQRGLWAVVCYYCHQNEPLALVEYYVYGKELISGKDLICTSYAPKSYNFLFIEKGFETKEVAQQRLEELKNERAKGYTLIREVEK